MIGATLREIVDRLNQEAAKTTLGGCILNAAEDVAEISELEMRFNVPEEHCHRLGLQGGFIVGMLEDSASQLMRLAVGDQFRHPTVELKVSFLRPGKAGEYHTLAEMITKSSAIGVIRSRLFGPEKILVASATATVQIPA